MEKQLIDIKKSKLLFLMCCVVYTAIYIGRLNYSAALAGMIAEGVFRKPQAGLIGTVFFICYGSGQLINGYLGDQFSPFKMIFTGIALSCLSNFMMSLTDHYMIMTAIWGINGFAQSMLWPPILKIISTVLATEYRQKAYVHISVTVPIGTLLSYCVSLLVLEYSNWQMVFFVASFILAAVAFLWVIVSGRIIPHLVPTLEHLDEKEKKKEMQGNFFSLFVSSGMILFIFPVMIHGMLKDGIMTWVPTMITEIYSVSPSFSLFLTMFLPLINLTGAYICVYLFRKYLKSEIITAALFMGIAIFPLFALIFIEKTSLVVSVALLAIITTSIMAFNHMAITMAPIQFAKYKKVTTISGLLNSITYVGSAISSFGFGFLAEQFNWSVTILFWVGLALIAVVVCLFTIKRWGQFIRNN